MFLVREAELEVRVLPRPCHSDSGGMQGNLICVQGSHSTHHKAPDGADVTTAPPTPRLLGPEAFDSPGRRPCRGFTPNISGGCGREFFLKSRRWPDTQGPAGATAVAWPSSKGSKCGQKPHSICCLNCSQTSSWGEGRTKGCL